MEDARLLTFLSRLFGGKPFSGEKYNPDRFLSRLFGGKRHAVDDLGLAHFLSRLFGGKLEGLPRYL